MRSISHASSFESFHYEFRDNFIVSSLTLCGHFLWSDNAEHSGVAKLLHAGAPALCSGKGGGEGISRALHFRAQKTRHAL